MADPKVCVSLDGITVEELTDEAARANLAGADMVEVRFDRMFLVRPDPTIGDEEEGEHFQMPPEKDWETKDFSSINVDEMIESLKQALPLPVIFAARAVSEGGFFPGTETERQEVLSKAIESKVSWIDLEISISDSKRKKLFSLAKENGCKIIASHHDINNTPDSEDIVKLINENKDKGDVVKFCSTAHTHSDALQVVEAAFSLKDTGSSHSLMALNSGGDWVRLHAPILDQSLVYSTLQNDFKLADRGLINVRDLRDAWTLLEY